MDDVESSATARMFGPLELRIGGRRLGPRDFGGIKPKRLLEMLLLERGRVVSKDRLADSVWADALPERISATIESYISLQRRLLDTAEPGLGRRLIVTEHGGYRLSAGELTVDADRFDALLRQAAGAGPVQRRAALESAAALVAGDLLADERDAGWVELPRAHYSGALIQALVELAECCLELADLPAAAAAAARVLAVEPTNERASRAAMVAQYAAGDGDAALRSYQRCRQALADELGVDPGPRTSALHIAILRGEDAAGLLSPGRSGPPGGAPTVLPVRYADCAGARIAFQIIGDGAIDLVFVPSFVTNLGATWDDPTYATFLRRLASMSRLILFDKRGTGLSDPALDLPSLPERSAELLAVLDAADSRRAVLFGVCGGGAVCAQTAADHPDRTAGLILHGSSARLIRTEDYPWGWTPEQHERFLEAFEEAWLTGGRPELRNPGLAANPGYCDWFARYVRLAASPFTARRIADMNAAIDLRPLLPQIRTPCLVISRVGDVWLAPENSRYLARRIPGARLLELPGVDHDPWVGDPEPILAAVGEFVARIGSQSGFVAEKM